MCVFADGYGDWSMEGCERVDVNDTDDEVMCRCNHLSNFAVLLVSNVALSLYVPLILLDFKNV